MKSLVKKSIYTGLGLIGAGTDALKTLGQELAKKAEVSEVEGEKIARKLHTQSTKAAKEIRKNIDIEVTKVADAIHAAIQEDVKKAKPAGPAKVVKSKVTKPKAKATTSKKK